MKPYPYTICTACGLAFGTQKGASTFHRGTCDVCGQKKGITEARDYEPLNLPPEFEKPKRDMPEFFKSIFR